MGLKESISRKAQESGKASRIEQWKARMKKNKPKKKKKKKGKKTKQTGLEENLPNTFNHYHRVETKNYIQDPSESEGSENSDLERIEESGGKVAQAN